MSEIDSSDTAEITNADPAIALPQEVIAALEGEVVKQMKRMLKDVTRAHDASRARALSLESQLKHANKQQRLSIAIVTDLRRELQRLKDAGLCSGCLVRKAEIEDARARGKALADAAMAIERQEGKNTTPQVPALTITDYGDHE